MNRALTYRKTFKNICIHCCSGFWTNDMGKTFISLPLPQQTGKYRVQVCCRLRHHSNSLLFFFKVQRKANDIYINCLVQTVEYKQTNTKQPMHISWRLYFLHFPGMHNLLVTWRLHAQSLKAPHPCLFYSCSSEKFHVSSCSGKSKPIYKHILSYSGLFLQVRSRKPLHPTFWGGKSK